MGRLPFQSSKSWSVAHSETVKMVGRDFVLPPIMQLGDKKTKQGVREAAMKVPAQTKVIWGAGGGAAMTGGAEVGFPGYIASAFFQAAIALNFLASAAISSSATLTAAFASRVLLEALTKALSAALTKGLSAALRAALAATSASEALIALSFAYNLDVRISSKVKTPRQNWTYLSQARVLRRRILGHPHGRRTKEYLPQRCPLCLGVSLAVSRLVLASGIVSAVLMCNGSDATAGLQRSDV